MLLSWPPSVVPPALCECLGRPQWPDNFLKADDTPEISLRKYCQLGMPHDFYCLYFSACSKISTDLHAS